MSHGSQTYGGVPPVRTDLFTNMLRVQLQSAASLVQQCNRDNGWFDAERSVLEGHMLIVTEVAEMSEAWRETGLADTTAPDPQIVDHEYQNDGHGRPEHAPHCECVVRPAKLPKPEGYGSECADVLIRLLDQCTRDGVDLAGEFSRKLEYNRTRGYRHGGKKA